MSRYQAFYFSFGFIVMFSICQCTYDKAIPEDPMISNVSYSKDILPILVAHCLTCHADTSTNIHKPGYAFFNKFEELKNYALKKSVTNAAYTTLQARIRQIEYPGMPLDADPLPEEDIKKVEAWIKAGAPNN